MRDRKREPKVRSKSSTNLSKSFRERGLTGFVVLPKRKMRPAQPAEDPAVKALRRRGR